MAANLPSANEGIDEILGQLVASLPRPTTRYDPNPSRKSAALLALQTISLVSRQWSDAAQRRIVSKLVWAARDPGNSTGLKRWNTIRAY